MVIDCRGERRSSATQIAAGHSLTTLVTPKIKRITADVLQPH